MSLPEGTPGSRTHYTIDITAREKEACERLCYPPRAVGDWDLARDVIRKVADLPRTGQISHDKDPLSVVKSPVPEEHDNSSHQFKHINQRLDQIMSAISDFNDKLQGFFNRQDTAIADLQSDVKNLDDQIAQLKAQLGTVTPADQALLDGIVARVSAVSDKLDALDSLTPPVAPPAPTP